MQRSTVLLLTLVLIPAIFAAEPIPPGTQFGTVYVRVTDCSSGGPVVGASVYLDNPTHRASGITNSTGYAAVDVFAWFYSYYVTASGYKIEAGERRFSIGEVFQICLFPESAGFWRIVASVQKWQGDIHAGGSGWAIIRMKNLEPGVFNITAFEIWVSGYDGPAITHVVPGGVLLGRLVEKDVNITVNPRPDVPVGRLKAELRLKTTFTSADGRVEGPLTASTDLDYITILPYRTFKLRVLDFWGNNPVPDATVVLEPTLAGIEATYTLKTDENGYTTILRMPDGAYRMRIFYPSPYDGQIHLVKQSFPILVDLARSKVVTVSLYEAHLTVVDLAGRPLDTEFALGNVKSLTVDGFAQLRNVPRGRYDVKVWWRGIEVYNGSIKVDEPLVRNSPGGKLEAQAVVGDIVLQLRRFDGQKLRSPAKLEITPFESSQVDNETVAFSRLPKGEYIVKAFVYNRFKASESLAATFRFSIPKDHGEHIVRLEVFDTVVNVVDMDGRPAPMNTATVEGREVSVVNGRIELQDITASEYLIKAQWLGFTVLSETVTITPLTQPYITAKIYAMSLAVKGFDGSTVEKAVATIKIGDVNKTKEVVNGSVTFDLLPAGNHSLTVSMNGVKVFEGLVEADRHKAVVVDAGLVRVVVKDQRGNPVAGVEVEIAGVGKSRAGADGVVTLGQMPAGEYRYQARYKGFNLFSGVAKPGLAVNLTLPLYTLRIEVVNELNNPLEAVIEITREGVLLERRSGVEAYFTGLPQGPYLVRATVEPKQVEQQVLLTSDGQAVRITMPIVLAFGSILMSSSDLITIITPLAAALVAMVSTFFLSKAVRRKAKRAKGMV
ncbi:MAG: hypothetical protein QXF95_02605 [Candidatus Caldarchaeum sp.]